MNQDEELPSDLEWYRNQIAGHHPSVIKNGLREIGIIKIRNSSKLLKVVQEGIRGVCELKFYEDLQCSDADSNDELIIELRKFLPAYFGRRTLNIGNNEKLFFQLEDVIQPFTRPCIMDIKIGRVTYDPTADAKKQAAESSKCACQKVFGFRVLGYQIHAACGNPTSRDRIWGKALTEENIQQAFEEYLLRGWPEESTNILFEFIQRISFIQQWFNRQRIFHFYASSLLLAYEGRPAPASDNSPTTVNLPLIAGQSNNSKVDVRMIDFSHVFPADGQPDDNYIHGLNYILDVFKKIYNNLSTTGKI